MERYESEEGRRSKVSGGWWNIRCKAGRRFPIGKSVGIVESRCRKGCKALQREADARCREKLRRPGLSLTVPQSDTGGRVEDTKAFEITIVKELGKIAP